jgi:hypothetical protein
MQFTVIMRLVVKSIPYIDFLHTILLLLLCFYLISITQQKKIKYLFWIRL